MWWRGSGTCSRSSAAAKSGTQKQRAAWEVVLRGHFNGLRAACMRVCVYPFEEVLHVLGPCVHHQVVDLLRLDFLEHSPVRVGRHLAQVHVHVVLVAHQLAQFYQTWNQTHTQEFVLGGFSWRVFKCRRKTLLIVRRRSLWEFCLYFIGPY